MPSGIMFTTSSTNEYVQNIKILETHPSSSFRVEGSEALNMVQTSSSLFINTREYEFPLAVARGLYDKHSWMLKSGRNPDLDSATTPEDVWNGGGLYTGFPSGAPEIFQAFSTDAHDTGSFTITYLASVTSSAYQTATVTLQGTTPVDFSVSGIRCHTAYYTPLDNNSFNVGQITLRHKVTTGSIFLAIPAGANQSYMSGYTVPYNSNGYIYNVFCTTQGSTVTSVDGSLWIRLPGAGPRLRRNFTVSNGVWFTDDLKGMLSLPALTDIIVRVTNTTNNNVSVVAGYNVLLIQN